MPFRFHVVALPHTQTCKARHNTCAFTMKVLNFCRMMKSLGHTVVHYGAETSEVECDEHVDIISADEQRLLCPQNHRRDHYAVEWHSERPYWQLANGRAVVEIRRRKRPRDFLCLIAGRCQAPIAAAAGADMLTVEFGIGYEGTFAPYRVFESYTHMHRIYGREHQSPDGRFCDRVIPNYLDPEDFPAGAGDGDYYLFMGRLHRRKGLQIAVETLRRTGGRLLVAGQGCVQAEPGRIVASDGAVYEAEGLEFVGVADTERRAELMGAAKAVFVPTLYLEPFGTVNVEAQMCGTPVITTDWGAFVETVEQGTTGFRCRSLRQFVEATGQVGRLDRPSIRRRAIERWSIWNVRHEYQDYFEQLDDLWREGWYSMTR